MFWHLCHQRVTVYRQQSASPDASGGPQTATGDHAAVAALTNLRCAIQVQLRGGGKHWDTGQGLAEATHFAWFPKEHAFRAGDYLLDSRGYMYELLWWGFEFADSGRKVFTARLREAVGARS